MNRAVLLLKGIMQGEMGIPKALKLPILARLMSICEHKNTEIVTNVFWTLSNISFNYDGKMQIITNGYIPQIFNSLSHSE